jgi:hypothetical protein
MRQVGGERWEVLNRKWASVTSDLDMSHWDLSVCRSDGGNTE